MAKKRTERPAARYTEKIKKDEDVYTVEDFHQTCKDGFFIDYDGTGSPAKDGKKDPRPNMWIKPSNRHETIPNDATHIVWYNR